MSSISGQSSNYIGIVLPADYPGHLLLKICDSILSPLLSPLSPLKPHSRPWGRAKPASWQGHALSRRDDVITESSQEHDARESRTPLFSVNGGSIGSCKRDLLAFVSTNSRIREICGETIYHHIRVANLAIGDILVSRRNCLKHTRVLEIYISREFESSQAQTDLNLSRFFIQAGLIVLWCPSLHTVLLDVRSLPAEEYIWNSFTSRLRQRLFINANSSSLKHSPPLMPATSQENTIKGFGSERSTSKNATARWGDSQGLIHCSTRVSVPTLAIGVSYNAAGEAPGGFCGVMDSLLMAHTPGTDVFKGELYFLTAVEILIPRPSWGHEQAEGYALGIVLRRLRNLRRLGLHADGIPQSHSNGEFSLMRRPPYVAMDNKKIDSESAEDETFMTVADDGTILYESVSARNSTGLPSSHSGRTSALASAISPVQDGYGPETWWAGIFDGLTTTENDKADGYEAEVLTPQSLEELRISVSTPGGSVQAADFEAWFDLVLPYLRRMNKLATLVFDMTIDLQPDHGPYFSFPRNPPHAIKSHFLAQEEYIRRLVGGDSVSLGMSISVGAETTHAGIDVAGGIEVPTQQEGSQYLALDHLDSTSLTANGWCEQAVTPANQTLKNSVAYASNLRHVYFGDYYGLPPLPPSDERLVFDTNRAPMAHPHSPTSKVNSTRNEVDVDPSLKKHTRPSKKSSRSAQGERSTKAGRSLLPSKPVGDRSSRTDSSGGYSGTGSRAAPGMWWTIRGESHADVEQDSSGWPSSEGGSSSNPGTSTVGSPSWGWKGRYIVQGWEETSETPYPSSDYVLGDMGLGDEEEM